MRLSLATGWPYRDLIEADPKLVATIALAWDDMNTRDRDRDDDDTED